MISLAGQVTSSRCVETVRDLSDRLAPYGHLSEVREFHDFARPLLGLAA